MRFLVDANVWIEVFLDQAQADVAQSFLQAASPGQLAITDFALFACALRFRRSRARDAFPRLLREIEAAEAEILRLTLPELGRVWRITFELRLDFDDAYQYTAAQVRGLELVSFDADFDATPRPRLTPAAAVGKLNTSSEGSS